MASAKPAAAKACCKSWTENGQAARGGESSIRRLVHFELGHGRFHAHVTAGTAILVRTAFVTTLLRQVLFLCFFYYPHVFGLQIIPHVLGRRVV
jgi:hypothetical protein